LTRRVAILLFEGCQSLDVFGPLEVFHGANQQLEGLAGLALQLGATFVARSFSGDKAQLVPLIKAAISHRGAAVIDCISPCVAFNNHEGSTRSFDYVRAHNEAVNALDVMPEREVIEADYAPGAVIDVRQHDGSTLRFRKLAADYDPNDRIRAMSYLAEQKARGEIVTGLLFVDPDAEDLHADLNSTTVPLNSLGDADLCPGSAALTKINESLR
jgi:2-oxoglutarate ferredoxin oxidoreductase subunit beta